MPRRYTTTSRCVRLDDGTRLIVAIEPPRHITVWPVAGAARCIRRMIRAVRALCRNLVAHGVVPHSARLGVAIRKTGGIAQK